MPGRIAVADVADVMLALGTDRLPAQLAAMLRAIAPISYVVAFGYRGASRPLALFDDFPADRWQVFVGEYQEGPYLLDPFYLACGKEDAEGLFRIKDLAPDRFYQGEYFRNYYVQTGLAEEIAYFIRLAGDVTVVLSLMRAERPFSGREFRALHSVSLVVEAAIRQHWADLQHRFSQGPNAPKMQHTSGDLSRAFANFGLSVLTPREREVVEYTLKGHSAEATGLIMGIAPGTVRIHRRNIYVKLGISSQGELFARFIAALSNP
jgi:DNA-binding CsgD family transcriptional regulator